MSYDSASPMSGEYVSAYDQAALDHDWMSELSEEWISNHSAEPSEQGSGRGTSLRGVFGGRSGIIDTIPEEPETSTVRIVLGESDVHNTPEWKRRLEEANGPKDLFSPCHLENIFKEDPNLSGRDSSMASSPQSRQSPSHGASLTNTASFLKDITDNISMAAAASSKRLQQSPLRQVVNSEDVFPVLAQDDPPPNASSASSEKSSLRSSDAKSTHESTDEESSHSSHSSFGDPNEDLSIAEPTQTLIDQFSFYTSRPSDHDEITVHTPHEVQTDSGDESFRTAKVMQTPHPNASNSLGSSMEGKSRSVRFAPLNDHNEKSFAFDFTPQPTMDSPPQIERPQTPSQQTSAKNTPHNSPLKLFSRYDTFTNNKMHDVMANLLPGPDEDDTDMTNDRERKRARREALARERVPRVAPAHEIRHSRVASLTTQEMFAEAEDFMRDLRSMQRPSLESMRDVEESASHEQLNHTTEQQPEELDEEEDFGTSQIDEDNISSEFEDHPQSYIDYSQNSESEAYDSIRQVPSPGKLSVDNSSPGKKIIAPQNPPSRVSSAESMQVIHPDDVSHLLPTTIGSMTFDAARNAWYKVRQSQSVKKISEDDSISLRPTEQEEEDDDEENIFRDIDDLVVSDEEEESNMGSRPSSSGSRESPSEKVSEIVSENVEETNESLGESKYSGSPGEKMRGSAESYALHEPKEVKEPEHPTDTIEAPISLPPKSPLRNSVRSSPSISLPSPEKSIRSMPPSPLRNPLQPLLHQPTVPTPKSSVLSPTRPAHRKTPSIDKRPRPLPLPSLDTPEHEKHKTPQKSISEIRESPRRSKYQHLLATPKPKAPPQIDSPFLEPRESLRLSISPPPDNISFANTPKQDISFSVTTKMLVKHLTDFEPFEPYWEKLQFVDFRGKGVTSLDGLKSFCPRLEAIDIRECKVKYLTGLPPTMRVLKASGNRLDGLVSFAWGKNIQYLDLTNNEIDSLAGLSTLVHLRELRVDNNMITSLDGILQLDGLLKVSAQQNQISSLDFTDAKLSRLEVLECQRNCISWVEGFERLSHLMSLHLDDNNISSLQAKSVMKSLRTVKLCRNELESFDPKFAPELRTLYLDENQIQNFSGVKRLRLLENFSARSQRGKTNLAVHHLVELRKVYLSGNPIPLRLDRAFYNLQYLELAAIKLTALPQDFASRVPNVRILNLSFNSLKDVTPIRDMVLLKRLFLIGNRISSLSEGTTETLVSLTELQVLDLRLNPITLSFYPPVEAKKSDHHRDMFSLVTGRQAQSTWQERDKTFRSTMPRSWELRRKAYQGLIYTACPKLRWFDGSEVSRGHVVEGERVLKSLEGVVNSVRSDKKVSK